MLVGLTDDGAKVATTTALFRDDEEDLGITVDMAAVILGYVVSGGGLLGCFWKGFSFIVLAGMEVGRTLLR